jgi:Ca2+-binding RTX toxin-like protein
VSLRAPPPTNTYKWSATSWGADGTLLGGIAEANFADAIGGTSGNDKTNGFGGNDALSGNAGNDEIDGGVGDDLIGGGTGSDHISGGDGKDFINSSATLNVYKRYKPDDSWSPPGGQVVVTQGPGWGIYLDPQTDGTTTTVWSGSDSPAGDDGDFVDGGAGDDAIISGGGADHVLGGDGDDQIDGMGGDDVLEGGDGNDNIQADGIIKSGFMNSLAAQFHGNDFIDGGAGNDTLQAGGGSDVVFGGAGNDKIWSDASGKTSSPDYVDVAYHGNDYLDGEDGDDYLEGGGPTKPAYCMARPSCDCCSN